MSESFLPEYLVMVDAEMTGVVPKRDKLLQVAMVKLKLQGNQYVEYDRPLVLYFQHEGEPQNDFQNEHLSHIFERCNEATLQPGEAKEAICQWLGELKGKVTPCGDCVPTDIHFLKEKGCIDEPDIGDEGPIPGTFHYEYFDMNGIKALARHKMGKKEDVKELAGYDEENVHDALVDCRNQTKELNHYMKALLEADKIAAAIKAAARPAFKSHDLDLFWSILEIEERTEKYYLSSDADDEWKFQQEDNGKEDREEWAKEESEFWRDQGYPSHYFYSQKAVPKGSWLIHFTDANPMAIVQGGFLGRTVDIVGLTTGYKPGSHPGSLALAYPVDNVTHDRSGFGKYGKNAVLFQVREGIAAYHFGDEEVQVIFDVKGAYNLHPIRDEDGGLTLYDKTGQKQLLLCDRNQDCVDQMVGLVSKKKRAEKSRSRSAIEAAAKRKRPRMELPDHVLPTPMDDYALDDSKRAAVLRFDGKAQGCVTFEDFQDLLSAALLELQLTEEYRRSIAGILNMTRQEKGLELL